MDNARRLWVPEIVIGDSFEVPIRYVSGQQLIDITGWSATLYLRDETGAAVATVTSDGGAAGQLVLDGGTIHVSITERATARLEPNQRARFDLKLTTPQGRRFTLISTPAKFVEYSKGPQYRGVVVSRVGDMVTVEAPDVAIVELTERGVPGLNGSPGPVGPTGAGGAVALVAATAPVTQSGYPTIDGETLGEGDLLLDTAASNAALRGLWEARAGAWTRPDILQQPGTVVVIQAGSLAGSQWVMEATLPFTLGSTSQTWVRKDIVADTSIAIVDGRARVQAHIVITDAPWKATPLTTVRSGTCVSGSAEVVLDNVAGLEVGQELVVYGAGHAHGLGTPGTPEVIQQGATGVTTWEVYVYGLTLDRGYTVRSSLVTITDANATVSVTSPISVFPVRQAGVHQWVAVARRGGTGSFQVFGATLNHPHLDQLSEEFIPCITWTSNTALSAPEGLPVGAPTVAGANLLRGLIAEINGNTVTLDVSAGTSGTFTVVHSNKLAFEAALASIGDGSRGPYLQVPAAAFRIVGDLNVYYQSFIDGAGAFGDNAGSTLLFVDGYGLVNHSARTGDPWCPGRYVRAGWRVMEVNSAVRVQEYTVAGVTGTTEPTYPTTAGNSVADGAATMTCRASLTSGQWSQFVDFLVTNTTKTLPASRAATFHDLRYTLNLADNKDWTSGGVTVAGAYYRPTVANGFLYQSVGSFTMGGTEPTWSRRAGANVADGGNIFTAVWCPWDAGAAVLLYSRARVDLSVNETGSTAVFLMGRSGQINANCNNSQVSVRCVLNRGAGVVCDGPDSNNSNIWCDATANLGTGCTDNSQLGNYWGPSAHTSANGRRFLVTGGLAFQNTELSGACGAQYDNAYAEQGQVIDFYYPARWSGGTPGNGFTVTSTGLFDIDTARNSPRDFIMNSGAVYLTRRIGIRNSLSIEILRAGNSTDDDRDADSRIVWNADQERWDYNQYGVNTYRAMQWIAQDPRGSLMVFPDGFLVGAAAVERKVTALDAPPVIGIYRPGDFVLDTTGASLGWAITAQSGIGPAWSAGTKRISDLCSPGNGYTYVIAAIGNGTTSGATGGSAPTWNTTIGTTTVDGGVTWTNWGPDVIPVRRVDNRGLKTSELVDSSTTVTVADGSRFVRYVAQTANRTTTIGNGGSPKTQHQVVFERHHASAFTWAIVNAAAVTIYTFAAGEVGRFVANWDGSNFVAGPYSELA